MAMDRREWVPDELVTEKPNAARIYDFLLGGYHNFEPDRLAAEKLLQVHPDVRLSACVNRAFLRRCVQFLIAEGIDQFLDIGSGIPTVGNVHQVAHEANPSAHVVYVDIDPVAVAHSRAMLEGDVNATAIRADAREPDAILNHPEVKALLDLNRPTAILLVALLHLLPEDDQAYRVMRTFTAVLTPGSFVAISHPTYEEAPTEFRQQIDRLSSRAPAAYQYRSHPKILQFFDGLDLVEPGLVYTPLWRPEGPDDMLLDSPERAFCLAGVARKP
jgi:hypothetical protein